MDRDGSASVDELITAQQVADRLKIHFRTVYDMAQKGEIPSVRIGRYWRFVWPEVLKALDIGDEP